MEVPNKYGKGASDYIAKAFRYYSIIDGIQLRVNKNVMEIRNP